MENPCVCLTHITSLHEKGGGVSDGSFLDIHADLRDPERADLLPGIGVVESNRAMLTRESAKLGSLASLANGTEPHGLRSDMSVNLYNQLRVSKMLV